jgi:hypothetical protein
MIITINNAEGNLVYDVSKIEDTKRKNNASVTISKIGTINVLVEALNYASQAHQSGLEVILNESPEAQVDTPPEETEVVETTDES